MRSRFRLRAAAAVVLAIATVGALGGCSGSAGPSGSSGSSGSGGSPGDVAAARNPNLDPGTSLGGEKAPDFRLTNQFGQRMSLSQFRGKVVLLSFDDAKCSDVCPLTTESMLLAKQYLGRAGENVQLLGVDANPESVTVPDVMGYSRAHGLTNQWDFLTGTRAQLKSVWDAYHIGEKVEAGAIEHTPAVFVIDAQGKLDKLYITQMAYASVGQSAQVIAQEIAGLLPGRPKLLSRQSLGTITPFAPNQRVALPSATGPGPVPLGPGKARLVVFFATWLTQMSDLKRELTTLNAYQKYAAGHHLPPVTAVDEAVTEPSPRAVRSYLASAGKLDYPVGLDTTGRVADGYQAENQPWLALVNASGQVTWTSDDWVPLPDLEKAVAKHS